MCNDLFTQNMCGCETLMASDYKGCNWALENRRLYLARQSIAVTESEMTKIAQCELAKKKDYIRVPFNCSECEKRNQTLENQSAGLAPIGTSAGDIEKSCKVMHGDLPRRTRLGSNTENYSGLEEQCKGGEIEDELKKATE